MNIRKCFEILELDSDASLSEVRQAYLDLVNVWHPDRFIQNPRLREKAEGKLRGINTAYEKLTEYLSSARNVQSAAQEPCSRGATKADANSRAGCNQPSEQRSAGSSTRSKTEVAVEKGTQATLTVCYALFKAVKATVADLKDKKRQD
jgi:DnaJ-class molecular chaperone